MSEQEKCLYEMCGFVDGILDIGYDKVTHVCAMIENVDFWREPFLRFSKRKHAILTKISSPLYEVFLTAPSMEDGYIFRYFKDFKIDNAYSADQIYQLVSEFDQVLYCTDAKVKYAWQKKNATLVLHMHETRWLFMDAFFSEPIS